MTKMKKILLSTVLILAFAATSYAIPVRTAEMGTVPERNVSPAQNVCYLGYYNFCAGWVYYWSGYCYGLWDTAPLPPMYGTCFDLADCPDDCRHLYDFWWGCKRYTGYGKADVEVYCADQSCCPVGAPIWGMYGYSVDPTTPWQHFIVGDLELCICEQELNPEADGKFIIMITDQADGAGGVFGSHFVPYSDINYWNIQAGCETAWRCTGHSFVYRNVVDYCAVYGMPGAMWASGPTYGCTNYPPVPPGCHNYYYPTGFFTEFLIDAYVDCLGATATKKKSWSEIKTLYR
jgi:hypothetical protein